MSIRYLCWHFRYHLVRERVARAPHRHQRGCVPRTDGVRGFVSATPRRSRRRSHRRPQVGVKETSTWTRTLFLRGTLHMKNPRRARSTTKSESGRDVIKSTSQGWLFLWGAGASAKGTLLMLHLNLYLVSGNPVNTKKNPSTHFRGKG